MTRRHLSRLLKICTVVIPPDTPPPPKQLERQLMGLLGGNDDGYKLSKRDLDYYWAKLQEALTYQLPSTGPYVFILLMAVVLIGWIDMGGVGWFGRSGVRPSHLTPPYVF